MDNWQKRVVEEKQQLQTKLTKLGQFLDSGAFKDLLPEDQRLLLEQEKFMWGYLTTLGKRIARFPVEVE